MTRASKTTRGARERAGAGARNRVRRFYDRTADAESLRLDGDPYRRLERDMTVRTLARHLPASARILDVGGGPGAYLEPLSSLGYDVSLCDLSTENVRLARARARQLGLATPARRVRRADATDLGHYADGTFDGALVAGPLYHLTDEILRARAIAEVARVLRPGGVALFALLPRLHPLRYLLREASPASRRCRDAIDWDQLLGDGNYRNPFGDGGDPTFFTDAHLSEVGDFEAHLRRAGWRVLETLSAESFCAFLDVPLGRWVRGEADYQRLLALVEKTAHRRDQIGAAEHVLVCARRRRA